MTTGLPTGDWPIFDALTEQDRVAVLAATRRRHFNRREVLCHEGDPVEMMYLIEAGRVAVRVTNEHGDTVTVATFGKGAIVGEMALVGEPTERTATVVAIEPTDTWMLSRVAFNRLRVDYRSVDRFLVQLLAGHVKILASQLLKPSTSLCATAWYDDYSSCATIRPSLQTAPRSGCPSRRTTLPVWSVQPGRQSTKYCDPSNQSKRCGSTAGASKSSISQP